jgi:hypothetical protein
LDVAGITLLSAAYLAAIFQVSSDGLAHDLRALLANVLPVVVLGAAIRRLLPWIGRRPLGERIAAHAVLASLFSVLWYWLLMVLLGVFHGDTPLAFTVRPFNGGASSWQLLQGFAVYGILVALSIMQAPPAPMDYRGAAEAEDAASPHVQRRHFLRVGEEIEPLDPRRIVSIRGAGDQVEVTTPAGKHLIRATLSELEETLPAATFLRVHRSRIVNVERIVRAEPAGDGRMLLHMDNRETIETSRAGGRLLRARVI